MWACAHSRLVIRGSRNLPEQPILTSHFAPLLWKLSRRGGTSIHRSAFIFLIIINIVSESCGEFSIVIGPLAGGTLTILNSLAFTIES